MNAKQIRFTCIIAAAILFMLLFPPYGLKSNADPDLGYYRDFGYAFIGGLPRRRAADAQIHVPALSIQIISFLVIGGLLWFEFKEY